MKYLLTIILFAHCFFAFSQNKQLADLYEKREFEKLLKKSGYEKKVERGCTETLSLRSFVVEICFKKIPKVIEARS